ncbi:hypothetical protein GCM10007937_47610 [Mesorhizobium albiziae]|nr:hypothetical protein GCM10007937_47610 [Mesorhizobium albiziae]
MGPAILPLDKAASSSIRSWGGCALSMKIQRVDPSALGSALVIACTTRLPIPLLAHVRGGLVCVCVGKRAPRALLASIGAAIGRREARKQVCASPSDKIVAHSIGKRAPRASGANIGTAIGRS